MYVSNIQDKLNEKKIAQKKQSIFNVFLKNESIIKKFLRRFTSCSHEINDITQETILRALEAEKKRKIDEPKAYFFGIAKNVERKELDKN